MDSAASCVDHFGQYIDICVFKFRQGTKLEQRRRQFVHGGKLFKHIDAGRKTGFGFFAARQTELVKKNNADLFG